MTREVRWAEGAQQNSNHPIKKDWQSVKDWLGGWMGAWDRFWFTETQPHTLAVIRILTGAMLVYVHLIWATRIEDFLGPHAWLDRQTIQQLHAQDWTWSWLWYVDSWWAMLLHEVLAILAGLAMMLGLLTRVTIPVAWFLTLMICHRLTGTLFGLDQIVVMLTMYLMWSRSGSVWSLDAVWRDRRDASWWLPESSACVSNNVVTRLIQLHLCVVYLFGGLSKMRGDMWFDGSALWYAAVNYEYQSLDVTWLGHFPLLIALLTAVTIFWETFYIALVWPRLTRPLVLAIALFVHGGIALALGMITFGFIMLVANLAFVSPQAICCWGHRLSVFSGRVAAANK